NDPAAVAMPAAAKRLHLHGLAVHAGHGGLVVEAVDMAWPAIHEQEDDALGLGLEVRLLGRQRVGKGCLAALLTGGSLAAEETVVGKKPRQSDRGKPGSGLPEELATRTAAEGTAGAISRCVHHLRR